MRVPAQITRALASEAGMARVRRAATSAQAFLFRQLD
jgi:hypothetical protein